MHLEVELNTEDSVLITAILAGDLSHFDTLMKRYERLVYSVAFGFGKNSDNALDITQNVFIKVHQKLNLFKGNSSFKTWLLKIAYNEGINWVRKHNRFEMDSDISEKTETLEYETKADDSFLASENRAMIIASLNHLNHRYRQAIVLRYFENCSIAEIAEQLLCSEGVVKNMLYRSLRILKDKMNTNRYFTG